MEEGNRTKYGFVSMITKYMLTKFCNYDMTNIKIINIVSRSYIVLFKVIAKFYTSKWIIK